jgi:hypothetical protein
MFVPAFYRFRESGCEPGAGFQPIRSPNDFSEGARVFVGSYLPFHSHRHHHHKCSHIFVGSGEGTTEAVITRVDWPIIYYAYDGQADREKHQNVLAHTGSVKCVFFRQNGSNVAPARQNIDDVEHRVEIDGNNANAL